ncbi:MAG: DUF3616 domain-containing protein [Sulfitobacter sp.]
MIRDYLKICNVNFQRRTREMGKASLATLAAVSVVSLTSIAQAQEIVGWRHVKLTGEDKFQGTEPDNENEAKDISGAVCMPGVSCFAVSDEELFLHTFELKGNKKTRFKIGEVLNLAPNVEGELDLEALAVSGNTLYALGSHSFKRNGCKKQDSRSVLFYGTPNMDLAGKDEAIEMSQLSLAPAFAAVPELAVGYAKPLQKNGLNFEGMAALNGQLYFGLRAPYPEDESHSTFVLSYPVEGFDQDAIATPQLHRLNLADQPGAGIRAMERYGDDILILSGPAGVSKTSKKPTSENMDCQKQSLDRDHPFMLHLWDVDQKRIQKLVEIVPPRIDWKAEGLLSLQEKQADDKLISVVVLFDGADSGYPVRYDISLTSQD